MTRSVLIVFILALSMVAGLPGIADDEAHCEECVAGAQSVGRGDDLVLSLTNKCGKVADVTIWLKCHKKEIDMKSACMAPGSKTRRLGKCFGPWKFYWEYKLVENKSECIP